MDAHIEVALPLTLVLYLYTFVVPLLSLSISLTWFSKVESHLGDSSFQCFDMPNISIEPKFLSSIDDPELNDSSLSK